MSDVNSNININIDASDALTTIKNLQRQISLFHQEMARSGSAANQAAARGLQNTLMQNINATGQFRSQIRTIQSETEHFTEQLEKNKLSVGQYFRYAGASTKSFGKLWKKEFDTIEKVAVERVKTLQTQYIKLGRDANGALKSIAVRPLSLDMQNFATKAAIAAQKQQLLNQLLKQGSTAMLNWGKNTQWAGRQLMVGFTIPLAMAGTAAAKAYIDFEKAAIKFKRVYGDFNTSANETDKMADSIKKLALEYTKYGVAVTDTMNMAADAAAMGKTGVDLLQQVQQANKLAVLGNVEQSQALETTISLTNAFGIEADKLSSKIDFLNAVENQTVTSIEDLTIAIPKAAPVIKQLGGDVEDLAFFLTAMKEGGINASEGANALKSGLASMINPTKQASDMLAGYGINLKGIVDSNSGDIAKTVVTFAKELDKLKPLERAKAIEQLFGKFQFSRISTLFQNITKDGSQASQVLKMTQMTAEELQVLSEREMKKIESSPAYKFQKVLADIQAKLVPIGEAFLKAITPIVEKVGSILDGFNNMSDGAKQFATLATVAIAGIGPVALMTFGLIANGVANLIKMFAGIKSFFNGTRGEAQTLGDTTAYMTQKELEAQAVASSLEQGHAKLTQQFTAQTQAIQNLITEYERAIGAQQRMLAGMGGVGANTPGFSTGGTVAGPGGPTSDNLLARVSPGEEILSNATIAKGSGVIQELLNKVSGYVKPSKDSGFQETHMAMPLEKTPEVMAQMDRMVEGFSKVSDRLQSTFEILSDLTATKSTTLNQKAKNAGMTSEEFTSEWNRNSGEGFKNVATRAQVSGQLAVSPEIDKAVEQLDLEVGQRIAEKIDNGNIDKSVKGWLDELMASVTQEIIQEFSTSGDAAKAQVGTALAARGNTPVTYRSAGLQNLTDPTTGQAYKGAHEAIMGGVELGDIERRASAGGDQFFAAGTNVQIGRTASSGKARSNSATIGLAAKAGELSYENTPKIKDVKALEEKLNKQAEDLGKSGAEGFIEGGKDGLDSHSPSRKMHQVGMDGAQGLINGAQEGFAKIPGVPAPGSATPPPPPMTGGIPGVPTPPVAPQAQSGFLAKMKTVATDVGTKGLNLVADGVKKGSQVAINAAATALDNYMQAGYAEADRKDALRVQQQRVAGEILAATDAEYQALQAAQAAHREKITAGKAITQQEIDEAVERSRAIQKKEQVLQKEIANSGQDLEVIRQRLANAQKADMVNDIEAGNAQQDAANGGAAGTAGQQGMLIYGSEKEQVKSYGTIRDEWKQNKTSRADRKAQYKGFSKAQKKEFSKGAFRSVGGGMQKGAMVATAVAGAASMMPGPVGKAAQDATPLLGSLSMLSGLITGPVSGAFVALVAVVGGIMFAINKLDESFKNAAQQQMELSNKLGASAGAIDALAESTGSVTGSQYMEKINADKAKNIFAAPGKTTFGENFVQGDTGKGMVDAAKKELATAKGDSSGVVSNLTQQLSAGIISGAVSKQQAQSIASQLAYELGDMSIAFKVNAQVDKIVGPNGEDFEKDPIKVATRMYAQNAKDRESLMGGMNPGTLWSGGKNTALNRNITAGGTVLGAAGTGAAVGAAIGSVIPGVGTAIGAVVGTIGGAIVGTITAMGTLEEQAKKAGRAAGAVVANMTQGLEMQAQITDQLDAYYTKKLKEAEAEGDITEYKRLQVEYDKKKAELGKVNAQATQDMIDAYNTTDDAGKEAMNTGMQNALDVKFKDDANAQLVLPALKEQLDAMDDATAYIMRGQLLNGMDPTQMTKFLAANEGGTDEQIAKNKKSTEKLAAAGGTRLQDAMAASANITDQTVRTNFLTTVSGMDDAKAKEATDLALQIQSLGGVMEQSIDTFMNYTFSTEGEDAKARIDEMTTQLKGTKGKNFAETLDIVYEVNPQLKPKNEAEALANGQAFNQEYFDKLKNETQKDTYISTISTILNVMANVTTESDLQKNADFMAWVSENGLEFPGGHSVVWWKNKYAEAMGQKVTSTGVDLTGKAPKPKTTGGGGGGGPEAHWTDDVVKGMRDFVKPNQKLTTGINASVTALKNFKKAGDAAFNGLSQQLRNAGASEGMLQKILEDDAKNVGRFFKNGKLTAEGLKVQARVYQQSLGKFVDTQRSAAKVSKDQATAMTKLTAAGLSYVGASEMVQDAELAQAIAHGANKKQIAALIKAYKDAQIAAFRFNETTAEGRAKNDMDLAESQTAALQATADKYQTGLDMIASQEQDINKTYDKRMKALDKVLQINQDIAESQKDQLSMADALSKGDIFAAAKAMADQKAKDAQKNAEAQKQALTDAKDAQIAGLTATIGGKQMTREELEEKIKNINDQILKIKRDEIDAQNELIKKKEYEAKLDIAKAARNNVKAAAKKNGKTNAAGGGGNGGNNGANDNGKTKDDPKKPQTERQKKLADLDAKIAKAQKLEDKAEAKIAKEVKLLNSYKQMGSAGAAMIPGQQKKISALREEKAMYVRTIADYQKQKDAAMRTDTGISINRLDRAIGVNRLADGKSPKRMGIMKHPMARGVDVMPSMIGLKEFVMSAPAVQRYGTKFMNDVNSGRFDMDKNRKSGGDRPHKNFNPVYNISIDIAKTDAKPDEIATAVIRHLEGKNKAMIQGLGA